ncbi:MAG: bifunctional UDP-sugar hydrolase/5'-nucleotidase [Myxococcota bacterium]|nr:bifunctional UDP-sugar hydrolase/5'-nucleotidase [Myxococcota bacterium]
MNDFHGAFDEVPLRNEPSRARGGLPWLAAALAHLRAQAAENGQQLLVLDAGDLFQGSGAVNATKGMAAVRAATLLGIDATVLGNHDFDYGPSESRPEALRGALEEAIANSPFAWLAANINGDEEQHPIAGAQRWTIIERNDIRIGIIGLSTQETPQTTLAKHVVDLRFDDPVQVLRERVPELRAAGAELVIVLGHLRGDCSGPAEAPQCNEELGRVLSELPEGFIDVLVAGHAHAALSYRVGQSFVMEASSRGQALARLDLQLTPEGIDFARSTLHPLWVLEHDAVDPGCEGGAFPLTALDVGGVTLQPDASAISLVEELEVHTRSLCDVLGCADDALSRSELGESAVGNLVADAMLSVFPDADLAVQNPGGLRADLPQGALRREHLLGVMPFENSVVLVELSGEQLMLLLRIGSAEETGGHAVAGARYSFDPSCAEATDLDGDGSLAGWEQGCLCSLEIGGEAVQAEKRYRVAMNNFMSAGGDHLAAAVEGAPLLAEGPLVRDALVDYVSAMQGCVRRAQFLDDTQPRMRVQRCSPAR